MSDDFVTGLEAGMRRAGVDPTRPLLVAVSGGPDSTALLLGCMELRERTGPKVLAAHLNHGLRGKESDADAQFVSRLCAQVDVPCAVESADVRCFAEKRRLSLETAARQLRYDFLAREAARVDAQAVATGHTLDDQAETVLLHTVRGSGLRGLAGMVPYTVRDATPDAPEVHVVRPMLQIRRSDAAAYCRMMEVTPRIDSTNTDLRHARNRLRHEVLPIMQSLNEDVVAALARLADNAASDLTIVEHAVSETLESISTTEPGEVRLQKNPLDHLPAALTARLLIGAFREVSGTGDDLERRHVDDMLALLEGRAGTSLDLPHNVRLEVGYDDVRLALTSAPDWQRPYPASFEPHVLTVPGTMPLGDRHVLHADMVNAPAHLTASEPLTGYLNASLVHDVLTVRSRQDGDRFQPLGMAHDVKLQDYFVNSKVPRAWRNGVPLLVASRGIAWVAGGRPAEWAKVKPGDAVALRVKLTGPDELQHAGEA